MSTTNIKFRLKRIKGSYRCEAIDDATLLRIFYPILSKMHKKDVITCWNEERKLRNWCENAQEGDTYMGKGFEIAAIAIRK